MELKERLRQIRDTHSTLEGIEDFETLSAEDQYLVRKILDAADEMTLGLWYLRTEKDGEE